MKNLIKLVRTFKNINCGLSFTAKNALLIPYSNYSLASSVSGNYIKIYERSFIVYPGFGKLLLNSKCDCVIHPASPEKYPDANHASFAFYASKYTEIGAEVQAELLGENDIIRLTIKPRCEGFCEIWIPLKYDIEAEFENNASLKIKNMESDNIEINMERGPVKTENLKCRDVSVNTDSGTITISKVLQGNIFINAKATTFKADRLQGQRLHIQAGKLDTWIESSYIDEGTIFAKSGNVNVKNLHGSTNLHMDTGNISINGLHGALLAVINEGYVDAHISEVLADSLIQINKGGLHISFTDVSNQNLDITSTTLQVSPDIASLGSRSQTESGSTFRMERKFLPLLRAVVNNGETKLSVKDWFSSLGIKSSS